MQQTTLAGLPLKLVHHQGTCEVQDKALSPEDLFHLQVSPPHSGRVACCLFEDLIKDHVDCMEQLKLLKEHIHQIKDNKLLSDRGNAARTSGINGGKNNKARANDEVCVLYHWKVQQKKT
jgi:hypothetical protein